MSILIWDKPEKVMPVNQWKEISFDGGPPGGYVSNMSKEDMFKWKAKFVGGKIPRVEIRKTIEPGTQVLIVVTNGGFPAKVDPHWCPDGVERASKNKNVRISQNGPAFYSFDEIKELMQAVKERNKS